MACWDKETRGLWVGHARWGANYQNILQVLEHSLGQNILSLFVNDTMLNVAVMVKHLKWSNRNNRRQTWAVGQSRRAGTWVREGLWSSGHSFCPFGGQQGAAKGFKSFGRNNPKTFCISCSKLLPKHLLVEDSVAAHWSVHFGTLSRTIVQLLSVH